MAPGIVCIVGNFNEGAKVVIRDQKHRKPIAIAETQYSSAYIEKIKYGKVAKNLHYVGDEMWELSKKIKSTLL